jgi:hypothetical protein
VADRLETLFAEVVRLPKSGINATAWSLVPASSSAQTPSLTEEATSPPPAASVLIAKMEKVKSGEIAAFTLSHRAVVRIAAQIQRDRARHTGSRPRSAAAPATVRLGPNL